MCDFYQFQCKFNQLLLFRMQKSLFLHSKRIYMIIKAIKEKVSEHISKARPEQALAILQEWANEHGSTTAQTVANLISSDLNTLRREEIMGVARDVGRRIAEINLKILQFNWETNDSSFKIEPIIKEKPDVKEVKKKKFLATFAPTNLAGVKKEAQKIWNSVKKHPQIETQKVNHATIEKLATAIIDAGNDLFMFHFGGHADPKNIVLEGLLHLDKTRLSRLLLPNPQHQVQIIFLNGCLSYGHVSILTAKGVKAIIATNVKVDDAEAVRIAAYFYQLFFEKNFTLKNAFETAEATVTGKNSFITIVNPGEVDESQPLPSAWTLFIHSEHTEVMNWTLADFLTPIIG
jgi:CHAT domain